MASRQGSLGHTRARKAGRCQRRLWRCHLPQLARPLTSKSCGLRCCRKDHQPAGSSGQDARAKPCSCCHRGPLLSRPDRCLHDCRHSRDTATSEGGGLFEIEWSRWLDKPRACKLASFDGPTNPSSDVAAIMEHGRTSWKLSMSTMRTMSTISTKHDGHARGGEAPSDCQSLLLIASIQEAVLPSITIFLFPFNAQR